MLKLLLDSEADIFREFPPVI